MLSAEPEIGDAAKMTPLEKRLARRIHNQRRRLAQLEEFADWRTGEHDRKMKRAFMKLASERWDEIRRLKASRSFWEGFWDGFTAFMFRR